MVILEYDGSMNGLLCCIFEVYEYRLSVVRIMRQGILVYDAFADVKRVVTEKEKAARVWNGLSKRLSYQARKQFYYAYLSELTGTEDMLLQYAQHVFAHTRNVEQDYGNKAVLELAQTARKVGREKHRMEAFIRFQLLKDKIFYAGIEPDFNVLPIITPHFKSRYADQSWLIYDLKRKYGIYYDCLAEQVTEITLEWASGNKVNPDADILQEGEEMYALLWKDYFKSTGIPERKNMKLHIQHVPRRYWKYLTEKQL